MATFVAAKGHLPGAATRGPDADLRQWVRAQRRRRANDRLTPAQTAQLEQLPGWTWEHQDPWMAQRERYATWVANHHRQPRVNTGDAGERQLGAWAAYQRTLNGRRELDAERVASCALIDGWSWDPREESWQASLGRYRDWVDAHDRHPTASENAEQNTLATWARAQRRAYRDGRLPSSRVAELNKIPDWTWHIGR